MSTGWNKNQIGWRYDDLWEDGYRFDNENLKCWVIVPKDKANNEKEAVEWLVRNLETIRMYPHT